MNTPLTPFEALKLAVDRAGGQSSLARICGVAQPSVWKWVQSSKRMPAEYVLRAEAATGVSRHALRPDIYPVEHDGARFLGTDRNARNGNRFVGLDMRAPAR